MNYKNIKFENNKREWGKWCREFPGLFPGEYPRRYKKGNYYLELVYVMAGQVEFVGETFRKYNPETMNFENCSDAELPGLRGAFSTVIRSYESKFLPRGEKSGELFEALEE